MIIGIYHKLLRFQETRRFIRDPEAADALDMVYKTWSDEQIKFVSGRWVDMRGIGIAYTRHGPGTWVSGPADGLVDPSWATLHLN